MMNVVCMERPPEQLDSCKIVASGIATLEFDSSVRPGWVRSTTVLRIPLPPVAPRKFNAVQVLAWAYPVNGGRFPLFVATGEGAKLAYSWPDWEAYILVEEYTRRRRPLYTRSPVSYRAVPAPLRHLLATRMCKTRRKDDTLFPMPLFDGGFEALRDVVHRFGIVPSPRRYEPRIVLTHDIDTTEGFDFVKPIAEVESEFGMRSCWNVVARGYPVDYRVLDWLVERGFEIGLHGYSHDNKLVFLSATNMRRRLDRCRPLIDRYAIRGFRSPSWFRNAKLMRVLADYVDYDSSCLDFDWICPGGRGGVLTTNPFRFGRLVEIPTTLPFEECLLSGCQPNDAVDYWDDKMTWLSAVGGQVVVNTHPDPHYSGNPPMIRAYRSLLERLMEIHGEKWSLPSSLADEVLASE